MGPLSPLDWGEGSLCTVTEIQIRAMAGGQGSGVVAGKTLQILTVWSVMHHGITYNGRNGKCGIAHQMGTPPSLKEGKS